MEPRLKSFTSDFFRTLIEGSPFSYLVWEPVYQGETLIDFELLFFSPGIATFTDFQLERLQIGARLFDLYPVQDKYMPILAGVLQQHQTYTETHYHTPSKTWLRTSAMPLEGRIMLVVENATAFMQQEQLLHTVVEESPMPLLLLKAGRNGEGVITDFTILLTNRANARYVNQEKEAIIGRRWADVFPDVYITGLFQRAVETVERGRPQRFTLPYQGPGERRWMDILIVKHEDGALLTFYDVSESIRYQQQLVQMTQALQQSNDNIHQFTFVASHDLQEPLRKSKAFSDILLAKYGDRLDKEGLHLISRLQSSVKRMHSLVTDLLAYSRLTTRPVHMGPVNLNEMMKEVLADAEPVIRKTNASVEVEPLPGVRGDYRQLYQLMDNLLSNALKFRKQGQPPAVVIRSEVVQRPVLEPGAPPSEMKAYVRIDVRDEGIGIKEEHYDRIFEMFQRLHGAGHYPGTGVGLALCKKIAENHNGLITVSSVPQAGTTFSVYLPLA